MKTVWITILIFLTSSGTASAQLAGSELSQFGIKLSSSVAIVDDLDPEVQCGFEIEIEFDPKLVDVRENTPKHLSFTVWDTDRIIKVAEDSIALRNQPVSRQYYIADDRRYSYILIIGIVESGTYKNLTIDIVEQISMGDVDTIIDSSRVHCAK